MAEISGCVIVRSRQRLFFLRFPVPHVERRFGITRVPGFNSWGSFERIGK